MSFSHVVNRLICSLESSSYYPSKFWWFDVSPPRVSAAVVLEISLFEKKAVAVLPKEKLLSWFSFVFFVRARNLDNRNCRPLPLNHKGKRVSALGKIHNEAKLRNISIWFMRYRQECGQVLLH
jgi:hypothetical protein